MGSLSTRPPQAPVCCSSRTRQASSVTTTRRASSSPRARPPRCDSGFDTGCGLGGEGGEGRGDAAAEEGAPRGGGGALPDRAVQERRRPERRAVASLGAEHTTAPSEPPLASIAPRVPCRAIEPPSRPSTMPRPPCARRAVSLTRRPRPDRERRLTSGLRTGASDHDPLPLPGRGLSACRARRWSRAPSVCCRTHPHVAAGAAPGAAVRYPGRALVG